jgi:hypothetical protein
MVDNTPLIPPQNPIKENKFDPEYTELIRRMAQEFGATMSQISAVLGVSPRTVQAWCQKHDEFKDTIDQARAVADSRVEKSMYQRAIGYEHEAEKIFCNKDGQVTRVPYIERYPPDNASMIFWMKNRRKDEWKECREVEGASGGALPIINITLNTPAGEISMMPAIDTSKAEPKAPELPAPTKQKKKK